MRSIWVLPVALSCFIGCSGGGPEVTTPGMGAADTPSPLASLHPDEQLLTGWRLHIADGSASIELLPERAATGPIQGRSYDLDIARFINTGSLRARRIRFDLTGDFLIDVVHRHPFAAPDFAQPVTAMNRADLGYTGKLLVLTDSTHVDFPDQGLMADPTVVRNPDGYAATGDLLAKAGITNNLFPYLLLVDEARDNRLGLSNGGIPKGNYDAATGGWQQPNAGAGGDEWTGYDYIHQGQSVETTIAVPIELIEAGPVTIDLAILIKYTDPRGLPGRINRFPTEPPNVLDFAYRLPHAAFDVGRCQTCEDVQLLGQVGAATEIEVRVRDWDADATEGPDDTLYDETDPALISPGATGLPEVTLHCPPLWAAPIALTRDAGDGLPGSEYVFRGTAANTEGTVAADTYHALVIAEDPEQNAPASAANRFGVDPNTLAADPVRALPLRSYNIIPIEVNGYRGWTHAWGVGGFDFPTDVAIAADGTVAVVYYAAGAQTVDLDPSRCVDFQPFRGGTDMFVAWLDAQGNVYRQYRFGHGASGANNINGGNCGFDSEGGLIISGGHTAIGTDWDPGPTVVNSEPFLFGHLTYIVRYDVNGALDWVHSMGKGSSSVIPNGMTVAGTEVYLVGSFADTPDFDPGAGTVTLTSENQTDAFLAKFDTDGNFIYVRGFHGQGGQHGYDATVFANGDVAVGGSAGVDFDMDPTAGEERYTSGDIDCWITRLSGDGNTYRWGNAWGADESGDVVYNLGGQADGDIVASGHWGKTVDFDPGPGDDTRTSVGFGDIFATRFNEAGDYMGAVTLGSIEHDTSYGGTVGADGTIYLSATVEGTVDLDPGPGTVMHTVGGSGDPILLHLDEDLNFAWVATVDGTGYGQGIEAAVHSTGIPLLLTAAFGENDAHPGAPNVPLFTRSIESMAIIRYRPDGQW